MHYYLVQQFRGRSYAQDQAPDWGARESFRHRHRRPHRRRRPRRFLLDQARLPFHNQSLICVFFYILYYHVIGMEYHCLCRSLIFVGETGWPPLVGSPFPAIFYLSFFIGSGLFGMRQSTRPCRLWRRLWMVFTVKWQRLRMISRYIQLLAAFC